MTDRGGIRNADAYARGKMLDHSAWQRTAPSLPRRITPSDIDMVFDNDGWLLLCEVSSQHDDWGTIDKGQRRTYENAVFHTVNCAVLARHSVPLTPARAIDTRSDITSFQVMLYDPSVGLVRTATFDGNKTWQHFVQRWFREPKVVRARCVALATQEAA